MPKVNRVNAARTDIYSVGQLVDKVNRKGQPVQVRDRTKAAPRDTLLVKKGEPYFWWQFAYGSKQISTTYPKPSQLTQSAYYTELYDIQEEIDILDPCSAEGLKEGVENIIQRLEELRDATQDSLDNMPESLQQAPTGELLQERIDKLEEVISKFENLDLDYMDDSENINDDTEQELADWIEGVLEEVRNIDLE